LVHPPDGSPGLRVAAARALARALRDAGETRQQRTIAAVGRSSACPFDLHALLPVRTTSWRWGRTIPPAAPGCAPTGARPGRCATCAERRKNPIAGCGAPRAARALHSLGARPPAGYRDG